MAYDVDLEYRIDRLKDRLGDIHKKRMFGGIGYLTGGTTHYTIHN